MKKYDGVTGGKEHLTTLSVNAFFFTSGRDTQAQHRVKNRRPKASKKQKYLHDLDKKTKVRSSAAKCLF